MIKLPNISSRVRGSDVEGDWVTVGVLVDKLPPKDTVKGDKYAMWKLSDLSAQSAVVLLFLFGKAYQEHWKMAQGSVVALLNPTIMPNREVGRAHTHTHTHTHTVRYSGYQLQTVSSLSGHPAQADAGRNIPRLHRLSSHYQSRSQVL